MLPTHVWWWSFFSGIQDMCPHTAGQHMSDDDHFSEGQTVTHGSRWSFFANQTQNLLILCKTETFVFWHITEISARYRRQNDRTDVAHLFCFKKSHTKKHNLDSFFQGAFFGEVFAQQGRARGPGARGPYGPWPIWALAHMGPGLILAYLIFSISDPIFKHMAADDHFLSR